MTAETLTAAGCVAAGAGDAERGLLILGKPGVGKSSLALRLIALGAELVSDDQTLLRRDARGLTAQAPEPLHGLIEAREIGVLRLPARRSARLTHAVELSPKGQHARPRCPSLREIRFLGAALPLLSCQESSAAAGALIALLRGGVLADPDQPVAQLLRRGADRDAD